MTAAPKKGLPGRESARDMAEAATMRAKKSLAVQVRLLQMETEQLQLIANRLSEIATAIAIANGIKERVRVEEGEGED